jgi:hypothetical protein
VTYKKKEQVYEVHARPIWDWALDLLDNPLLAPQFVWDACRVYKRNDTEFEHFFDEPWTGDRWWDIQVHNSCLFLNQTYRFMLCISM